MQDGCVTDQFSANQTFVFDYIYLEREEKGRSEC